MKRHLEASKALNHLGSVFMSVSQRAVLGEGLRSAEGEGIAELVMRNIEVIRNTPGTYSQDGLGEKAVAYLHYFKGGMNWYITEQDMFEEGSLHIQHQAYGLADLGYGPEYGYISIEELIKNGVELDLHWVPKTLAEIRM